MTVSELKTAIFSIMQSFNQVIPAEEQLRALSQTPVTQPLPVAVKIQMEIRLKQLIARYAILQQNAAEQAGSGNR